MWPDFEFKASLKRFMIVFDSRFLQRCRSRFVADAQRRSWRLKVQIIRVFRSQVAF